MVTVSIGRAWEETKAFIARDKRLLVPLVLGLIVLPTAVVGLVAPGAQLGGQEKDLTGAVLTLVGALIGLIAQLTVIRLALGFSGSLGDAIRLAVGRLWILLAAMAILVLPFVLLSVTVGGVVDPKSGAAASGVKGVAAVFLLLMIGVFVWLAVRVLLVSVVTMAEENGPVALLKRSFAITRGHFWRLLVFVLLMLAAFLALIVAVGVVGAALVTALLGAPDAMTIGALIVGLLSGLVQAGVVVVYVSMLSRIYTQLAAAEG